jgi:hypothetical protein
VAKRPEHANERWTKPQEALLKKRAKGNTPTGLIADELGRSKSAVQSKASDVDVSLKPTNQSPYNRRKK